jgi:hypothetical protein
MREVDSFVVVAAPGFLAGHDLREGGVDGVIIQLSRQVHHCGRDDAAMFDDIPIVDDEFLTLPQEIELAFVP